MDNLFNACLGFTLAQEGGYVDDPDDPGGATNMGITLATLQQWNRDPALGPVAVQDMTEQTAAAIYAALYWNVLRGHALPAGIDLTAFDFGVNAGTRCSAKLLQQALGFPPNQVDGYVGPQTLAAAAKANAAQAIGDLAELQANYYRGLDDFADFGTAWLARTDRRRQAALALLAQSTAPSTVQV
jgi:lysozyme family protein